MKTFYAKCRAVLCTMGVAATICVATIPVSFADPIKTQSYRERQRHVFRHVQRPDHVAGSAPIATETTPMAAPIPMFPFFLPAPSIDNAGTRPTK